MNKTTITLLYGFLIFFSASNAYTQTNNDLIDSLITNLVDSQKPDTVRLEAADKLSRMKIFGSAFIKSLIQCFSDENPYLRGKATLLLANTGKESVPSLIDALQNENENVRWSAAITLSKLGKGASEALTYLVQALEDKNRNVRWCSLIALGNLGAAAAEHSSHIAKFLSNEDDDIKWAAVYALNKINPSIISEPPDFDFVKATTDSLIPQLMDKYKIPGVAVCLVKDRKISWSKNYGVPDVRSNKPVTNETMFEACSMTKPVFALLALRLVDEGKLNLDKPLSEYLDENFVSLYDYDTEITARMILCHTAGFPNWRKGEEETDGPLPIYFEPGSKFSYSGEGYYYLQRVVEKITGEPINDYAKRILFEPLKLNHTNFSWTGELDPFISAGHDASGNYLMKTQYTHSNAAYSLYVSASDYAKIICSLLNREDNPISQDLINEMRSHQVEVNVREPINRPGKTLGLQVYWGLGWAIDSTVSGDIVYHSGANRSGFRCYSQFNYDKGTAIAIMTNGLNGSEFWRSLISKIGDF